MGHDVGPGQNYCPQGHPIALEQVQFAQNAPPPQAAPAAPYGAASAPAGGAKYAQAGPAAAPPQPASAYAGYGAPPQYPPQPPVYAPPQPAPAYTPAQPMGYAPPAAPPPAAAPYGPPAAGPPAAPGFGSALPVPVPEPAPVVATALTAFLVSFDGNADGEFWPLHGGRFTLGRANSGETVDIALADATISSRHASIEVDALTGTVSVEDTGSTNGTFHNDEHIGFNGRRELRDGDRLRLGGYTTIVKVIKRG